MDPENSGMPASGIGSATPSFVHSERTGVTSTPPIPSLSPAQFGPRSNWAQSQVPMAKSALYAPKPGMGM